MGRKSLSPEGSPSRNTWGLTLKQEAFAQQYAKHGNAANAYRVVYESGMGVQACHVEGCKLLANPAIALRVDLIRDEFAKSGAPEIDELVAKMNAIVEFDVKTIINEDGSVRPVDDWPEHARRIVTHIEVEELFEMQGEGKEREKVHIGRVKKIKFASREKCLDMLARYRKMFGDQPNSGRKRLEDMTIEELDAFIASREAAQAAIRAVSKKSKRVMELAAKGNGNGHSAPGEPQKG